MAHVVTSPCMSGVNQKFIFLSINIQNFQFFKEFLSQASIWTYEWNTKPSYRCEKISTFLLSPPKKKRTCENEIGKDAICSPNVVLVENLSMLIKWSFWNFIVDNWNWRFKSKTNRSWSRHICSWCDDVRKASIK